MELSKGEVTLRLKKSALLAIAVSGLLLVSVSFLTGYLLAYETKSAPIIIEACAGE